MLLKLHLTSLWPALLSMSYHFILFLVLLVSGDSPYLKLLLIGQLDFILLPKAFHAGVQLLWHNFSILWQLNSETIQWEDVGYKTVQYRSKKLSVLSLHQWGENAKLHVNMRRQLNWVITDTFRSIRSFSFFLAIINNTIYFYRDWNN